MPPQFGQEKVGSSSGEHDAAFVSGRASATMQRAAAAVVSLDVIMTKVNMVVINIHRNIFTKVNVYITKIRLFSYSCTETVRKNMRFYRFYVLLIAN